MTHGISWLEFHIVFFGGNVPKSWNPEIQEQGTAWPHSSIHQDDGQPCAGTVGKGTCSGRENQQKGHIINKTGWKVTTRWRKAGKLLIQATQSCQDLAASEQSCCGQGPNCQQSWPDASAPSALQPVSFPSGICRSRTSSRAAPVRKTYLSGKNTYLLKLCLGNLLMEKKTFIFLLEPIHSA